MTSAKIPCVAVAASLMVVLAFPGQVSAKKKGGKATKATSAEGKASPEKKGKKTGKEKQEAADPKMQEAVDHFQKGVAFFKKGNFSAALAEFTRSYEIVPNEDLLYNIGVCYLETGKGAKALETFEQYLARVGTAVPPDTKKEVDDMMAEIRSGIGTLTIACGQTGADVVIDEFTAYLTPLDKPIPLDPGLHTLVVRKKGFEKYTMEFSIASGQDKTLKVDLKAVEKDIAAPVIIAAKTGETSPEPVKKKKPLRWLWFTLGAGGAIGAAAAVTGGLVLKKKGDMRDAADACTNTLTREACPEAYDARDEGKKLMLATNILAGIGGAVALTGMILFILDKPRGAEKKPGREKDGKKASTQLSVTGSGSHVGFLAVVSF